LVWKANKEHITASDKEIVAVIKKWFARNGYMNKTAYLRFLDYGVHMTPRIFEGCVADFIRIDKLYKKILKNNPTEVQVRDLFIHDTQKVKMGYILVPFENFLGAVTISDGDLKKYYEQNTYFFKDSDAKTPPAFDTIKDKVLARAKEALARQKANDKAQEIIVLANTLKVKNLKDLKLDNGLKYTETAPFRNGDYIEGIGLDQRMSALAFSLKENEIYKEAVAHPKGFFVIQLLEKTPVDEKKFKATKAQYAEYLQKQNAADAQAQLIEDIKNESRFEVYEKQPTSQDTSLQTK